MTNNRKARVLVVDAEPVSRFGLVHLFNAHERLQVVAEAEAMPVARELCLRHRPELVVLDAALGDGLGFVREVKQLSPKGRVVVFTSQVDALCVTRAFRAGAEGYVTRRDSVSSLMSTVLGVLDGERQVAPSVQRVLVEQMVTGGAEVRGRAESVLSDRELQVYQLLGQGLKARAVAAELRLSVKTVETHVQRIKVKLGVANAGELQRRAILAQSAGSEEGLAVLPG